VHKRKIKLIYIFLSIVYEKKEYSMRIEINPDLCKGCGICITFCPQKVLTMELIKEVPVVSDIEKCIGCCFCELRCPDFAIEVIKEDEKEIYTG